MAQDSILSYYEQELAFLRRQGDAFARRYSKIAGHLLLEPDKCDDPHVERLLEGVAFLAARVHHKLDEEFPEITAAFLEAVAPSYLAPLPSFSIARFVGKKESPWHTLPSGTLLHTRPLREYDLRCRFRTCYPVTLWPAFIREVRLQLPGAAGLPAGNGAAGVLRLSVRCSLGSFTEVPPPGDPAPLRLFLDGERRFQIYELLLGAALRGSDRPVLCRDARGRLHELSLRPVGFEQGEGLLPSSRPTFLGYQILKEYFAFPQKYLFFDLCGIDRELLLASGEQLDILIPLERPPVVGLNLEPEDFLLGCTPVVNLFPVLAEPIPLTLHRAEHRVIPDARRQEGLEVYSIDEVQLAAPGRVEPQRLQPLFQTRVAADTGGRQSLFTASRRAGQTGTELYLSLLDPNLNPLLPDQGTLIVHTTCSNRDLASRLPIGTTRRQRTATGELDLSAPGEFWLTAAQSDAVIAIDCLERPSVARMPTLGRGAHWQLISHLSLNHLSLSGGSSALQALKELLALYDFARPGGTYPEVSGLQSLTTRSTVARIGGGCDGFCRGHELTLELDEDRFVGGSMMLFAAVLDRFFGLYVSLNSFTQLVVSASRRLERVRFPVRAGERVLL